MAKGVLTPVIILLLLSSCGELESQQPKTSSMQNEVEQLSECEQHYDNWEDNLLKSKVSGSVSDGSLTNGKMMPYHGNNFTYFDNESYLANRAFTSQEVKTSILESYKTLEKLAPGRQFYLMELSNEKGGKIYPHRTHQNGLSVDFMMPMLKNNQAYYGLDTLGKNHYLLSFNENGEYSEDKEVKVDFDLIALHILQLNKAAKEQGLKISKVIIKIEYKDDLFNTPNGKKLKASGVYIVKGLTPLINHLHDDHYHIDFEKV
jgi:penicillin-insensitive murein endopeptidase